MQNIIQFPSNWFHWRNGKGVVDASDLQIDVFPLKCFDVKSLRTGKVEHFTINTLSPNYEDGWDGECVEYVNSSNQFTITIFNA